jgi:hypothetical protein
MSTNTQRAARSPKGGPVTRRRIPIGFIAFALLSSVAASARADLSISPPNPSAGSTIALSACVALERLDAVPTTFEVKLDGKRVVYQSKDFGWCEDVIPRFGVPGSIGVGVRAYATDSMDGSGTSSDTTVPTVLFNVGEPGEHTIAAAALYADGARQQESVVIHVSALNGHVVHPGSDVPTFVSLSPPHGPAGTQVHVSACGYEGPQGSRYDLLLDGAQAFLNLTVAACASGKFGFGTGTSLPAVHVSISGARGSRHTIEVTNLGSATFVVDP